MTFTISTMISATSGAMIPHKQKVIVTGLGWVLIQEEVGASVILAVEVVWEGMVMVEDVLAVVEAVLVQMVVVVVMEEGVVLAEDVVEGDVVVVEDAVEGAVEGVAEDVVEIRARVTLADLGKGPKSPGSQRFLRPN